ncbi:unnamed protein product [Ceutorhynchus assimilis]|uniref:C2H2-type domain-containing protein n=1 Tax=Ceutorhynchus assimilis TaxID=467358 RepID=A0A9N9QPH7_9CUCU|nr:unnamed protein product [Ceutorhynchus assimilis]
MESSHIFCCICIEDKPGLASLKECDENGINHREKLIMCAPNQNWDKKLSICKLCIDQLNTVYKFIELCKVSEILRDEKLKQYDDELSKPPGEIFTCDPCQKTFKKKRFLKTHITKAHTDEKFKKKFGKRKTDEKENTQEAENSNFTETYKEEYPNNDQSEETNSNENDNYFSDNDDWASSSEEEKPKPEKTKKKIKIERPESFTCEYCGKQFRRHQHWSAHIRSKHTFEKPYKCQLCEASFATSHSLLVHKRNHNNEKPYVCSSCGKGFVCSGDLFHHNKIHLNKKEYECNICSKRFNTTSILRTHKIVKHTEPQYWKYICKLCDRRFPINSSLSLHMKRHTGIKDHPCHICGKKFFNKSEVSKHILSHSNQKRFKCTLCEEKEYKNKESLNKHLKLIHDMGTWKAPKLEKKYLCSYCPKKFDFNNKLQRHLLTHTGEKPYKCDFCVKKFSDTYYRKSHMKKEHANLYEQEQEDPKYILEYKQV